MAKNIRNSTREQLVLRLSDGVEIYLKPQETKELTSEQFNSPAVQRGLQRRMLRVTR